jgi:hypothetical protein
MTVPIRKFEPGCNTDYLGDFLEKCGWSVSAYGGMVFKVKKSGAKGAGKKMSRKQVIALLDEERIKRGLEPIRRESSAIKSTVSQRFTKNTGV